MARSQIELLYNKGRYEELHNVFVQSIEKKYYKFDDIRGWMSICSGMGYARIADYAHLFYDRFSIKEKAIIDSYLAIEMWLSDDLNGIGELFGRARGRANYEGKGKEDIYAIAHMKMIARLVGERINQPERYDSNKFYKQIHVIGDSHSVVLANRIIPWGNSKYRCITHPIRGLKLYHLGLEKKNEYREYFKNIIKNIDSEEILLSAGEIDMRPHEGIFFFCKKRNISDKAAQARKTFEKAVNYVSSFDGKDFCIIGPHYPRYNLSKYLPGEESEFKEFFVESERILQKACLDVGLKYIRNIDACDADRAAEYMLDDFHMKPMFYDLMSERVLGRMQGAESLSHKKQMQGTAMTEDQKITIDGKDYALSEMSDAAKEQLNNLKITEQEIQRLATQTAIAQTARVAYIQALKAALDGAAAAAPKLQI